MNTNKKPTRSLRDRPKRNFSNKKRVSGPAKRGGGKRSFNKRKRSKKESIIDPSFFVKKAKPIKETFYNPSRTYKDINLHPELQKSLTIKKFINPTEIQDKTLDHSMLGENILGIADTGTGKTGAFLIPILDRLLKSDTKFKSLVVLPTRELANQVEADFLGLKRNLKIFSSCFVGGTSVRRDLRRLSMDNHLIIGTPGRLLDMVKRGALKLDNIEILVIDEFDRMLDMGFINDIRSMLKGMTGLKQTMLFSATLDQKLKPIVEEVVKNPYKALISSGGSSSDNVNQDVIKVGRNENKFEKLVNLLNSDDFSKTIIFAETKRAVDRLDKDLRKSGIKSNSIHGDKSQRERTFSLEKFKKGRVDVLIATDVAARGLDIKGVSHVINYEPPRDYDSYIHRIGRTGRAGKIGHALTFIKA